MYLDFNLGLLQTEENDADSLLNHLVDMLEEENIVKRSFREAIFEREQAYPTGLMINSFGFAIPHADNSHVNKSQICYATLKEPVIFKSMTDPNESVEVNMVFMITMKEPHEQLEMLQNLMSLFQNEEQVKDLMTLTDKDEFKRKLIKAGIN
ncbi:PTS sugar transporter subunit IIA [Aerococcus urinaehominis]|uniref:PTS sugar transporter subunit IIA n=1 Tax=Aerococcus urinaehominis TaxID=128944 RepID=A0A109RH48_9LACT|nr:PTS sugar transporter subunit IIA [Aerococcus urinaehominis]AMB99894.1 PTS sugar transporter subunit IIA [Aerococcus urinaehominis]SDM52745.1 PTS system, galactitol-specific IIA component [Aerococcus urinaehominis]